MARLGEIIDGKYEVLREIGKGGMSVVYLAMDKRLNKQWAIKEFRKDKDDASKQVALKALLDEANLMKKLDHPTLPRIVDIIETNQTVYIVMDYIEGESLNKVLDAYGAQPQEAVVEWAKQLSEVLDYLHTQNPPVIYRDMKPANIMLKPDGTVRLIDFGIAREYKEGKEGDTEAIGTRGYAAPEQFGGRGQTDARTDIYSLGVTLYHLVTGKNPAEPPYEIYPIRHWDPTLSSGLEWLIQKCTQLNPNDRYQSCAEVTYVLENLDKFEGTYQKKLRGKVTLFIVSASLALFFGIACVGFLFGASAEKKNTYEANVNLNTVVGYQTALEIDDENSEAYKKFAEYLHDHTTKLYAELPQGVTDTTDDTIYKSGDIDSWFNIDRMTQLLENDPATYAQVNFELGRLYWNYYESPSGEESAKIEKAAGYFEKVMNVAYGTNGEDGLEIAGLDSSKKYNMAQAYYLVAYFQTKKEDILKSDDGDVPVTDAAIQAGIQFNEGGALKNPYYTFWETNKKLIKMIAEEKDMTNVVKLEAMRRLCYILNDNYEAYGKYTVNEEKVINGEDMIEFFADFSSALDSIQTTGDEEELKNEIKKSLNTVRKLVAAHYEVKIEEVK